MLCMLNIPCRFQNVWSYLFNMVWSYNCLHYYLCRFVITPSGVVLDLVQLNQWILRPNIFYPIGAKVYPLLFCGEWSPICLLCELLGVKFLLLPFLWERSPICLQYIRSACNRNLRSWLAEGWPRTILEWKRFAISQFKFINLWI